MTKFKTTMILTVATVAMLCIAPVAFAQTSTSTSTGTATATNTNTVNVGTAGAGGTGGAGGAGGSAVAVSDQHQGQSQSVSHSGNSASYSSSKGGSVKGSGNSENSYVSEAQQRNPVSSAASNFLTSSGDCIGSAGIGGQFVGFGGSIASTTSPSDCNRRADAAYWQKANEPVVAMARMCQDETNRQAIHDAGKLCPDEANAKPSVRRMSALPPSSKDENFPTNRNRFE